MHITIVGAGAWGTALAIAATRQSVSVSLHARDAAQAQAMQQQRRNERYLPGVDLPEGLNISSGSLADLAQQAQPEDLFVIALSLIHI
jgi:glycerol-3-phosphate dehydrogenase (NAD(P)+)